MQESNYCVHLWHGLTGLLFNNSCSCRKCNYEKLCFLFSFRWIIEIPPPRDFYCDTQVILCKFLYFHSTCFCTVVHIHPMVFCEDGFFVGMSVNFYSSFSIENEIKLNHYSGRKLVTLKLFTLSHDEDWEYSNRNIAFITRLICLTLTSWDKQLNIHLKITHFPSSPIK